MKKNRLFSPRDESYDNLNDERSKYSEESQCIHHAVNPDREKHPQPRPAYDSRNLKKDKYESYDDIYVS